jgi:hypothetical protein
MAQQLMDLDKVPQAFNRSRDLISRLIAEGEIVTYPAKRRTLRMRGGSTHRTTVDISRVSKKQVREALAAYDAGASEGEGLTNAEMKQALGISQTLWDRFKVKCDPLGGDPVRLSEQGRRDGRKVDLFAPAIRDAILAVFRAAKEGRVVIKKIAYLSTTRALDELRKVLPRCCYTTLAERLMPEKWRLLPGRGVPEFWWVESEISAFAEELRALKEGKYTEGDSTVYTSRAAGQIVNRSRNTITSWVQQGLLEPVELTNRRGPGRKRNCYTREALEEAKRIAETPNAETYDDGQEINLAIMARLLGATLRWTTNFVAHADSHTKAMLQPKPKPRRGQKPTTAVLKSGVLRLKRERKAAIREAKALKRAGWGTASDVAQVCPRSGTVLARVFETLRANGSECAREAWWVVPLGAKTCGRIVKGIFNTRLRWLWIYNLERAQDLIANPPPIEDANSPTTAPTVTEATIIEAAKLRGPARAKELAHAAGYKHSSYIREIIAKLLGKGLLRKTARGYVA